MRRNLAVAVLATVAVMLAGCGGSGTPSATATRSSAPSAPTSVLETRTTSTPATTASATSVGSGGSGAASFGPCGMAAAPPARWGHVVWIWLENHGPGALGSMPYLSSMARTCGLATNYSAIRHPSLPNYLAAVSGSTGGVTTDCSPRSCPQRRTTIFDQVRAKGGQWRAYQEAMPRNCGKSTTSTYAPKHNPPVYFTNLAADCARWDVPLSPALGNDLAARRLPQFAFITPDICNDGHDCSVGTADRWLRAWLGRILSSADYRGGRTAVVVTWDEDDHGAGNHVATVVIAPSVRPGTRSGTAFTHYSLLRTTEEMLGLPPLLAARMAPSMRAAFRL